jgi:hypothetical protein
MAGGITETIGSAIRLVLRFIGGSSFESATRFKGELGVKLLKKKKP